MNQWIGKLIALFLVMGFLAAGFLGAFSSWGIPYAGQVALAILLIAATLWISEMVPLFATSFIVLFLCLTWLQHSMILDGIKVSPDAFLTPFFSNIILLFLGGFVLSAALHKFHLDEQLAGWIIQWTGGSVARLMLGVMAITALLSMWLSNTATAAMMLSLIMPMVRSLPGGDPHRKALLLSIPFAANIGGLGTPIGSPPNAIAMQYLAEMQLAPSFNQWMLIGVPAAAIILCLAWALILIRYRGESTVQVQESPGPSIQWSRSTWFVCGVAGLTILGWVTTSWHGMATGTIALIPVILYFTTGILNVHDLRSLAWDVLLLMGGGLCLGVAMSESGLASWVVEKLPLGSLGIYGLTVAFGILACFMSSIMSNTATANLIMPIILGLSIETLSPVLFGVAFACSLAMPLPISTPPNAMAFSYGELRVADMVVTGTAITLAGLALILTVGYWYWGKVGLW